ncbi:MAG: PAS domain S-box protein [Fibrobacteria bacterium]|nr:PAS domain S-box protein [Fibrobacteria bacterium]
MTTSENKIILLVEDEILIALEQKERLEECGYQVIVAGSGEEAITITEENQSLDLIIMDVDLGDGMDGTQASALILQKKELPIVFLSNHTDQETVEKTEKIASYGYVIKNTGFAVLNTSIKMAFKLFNAKISEKEKEEALRISEEKYKTLVDASPYGILITDLNGKILFSNPTPGKFLGYTEEEIIGKYLWDLSASPKLAKQNKAYFEYVKKERPEPESYNAKSITKTGEVLDIHIDWSYMSNSRDGVTGFIVILSDITKRLQHEELLKNTLEATTDGIWTWDFNKDEINFSPRFYTMLGYKPDEFPASIDAWTDLIHPDDKDRAIKGAAEYLKTKPDFYEDQYRLRTKQEAYCWVHTKAKIVTRDEQGKGIFMIGSHEDITARKETELRLSEREEQYRLIINNIPDATWTSDYNGNMYWISKNIRNILGYSPDELYQDKQVFWVQIIHQSDKQKVSNAYSALFVKEENFELEYRVKKKNGDWIWVYNRAIKSYAKNGILYVDGILTDITARKQAEVSIEKSLEEKQSLLRELQRRFNDSFSMVLSIIRLTSNANASYEAKTALEQIDSKVSAIFELYSLLYTSESTADVKLDEYLTRVISRIPVTVPEITIRQKLDAITIPVQSAISVGLIAVELITNSLQHAFLENTSGGICISLTQNKFHGVLEVNDNGIGLPKDFDISKSKSIGMNIVTALLHQLDGELEIKKMQGTQISLSFPLPA